MSSLSEPDDERYGRFPSVLSVKTPLGMREQLRAVAAVEKISVGEFVRRTLGEALGVTILSDSTQCGSRPTWIMLLQSNASRWSTAMATTCRRQGPAAGARCRASPDAPTIELI